jgi:hypothetical protein
MLAGGEVMRNFGVEHYVGVFDARMVRIYRRIGSCPEVLGSQGEGRDRISVGLWEFTTEAQSRVSRAAGITPEMSARWFALSFDRTQPFVPMGQAGAVAPFAGMFAARHGFGPCAGLAILPRAALARTPRGKWQTGGFDLVRVRTQG